MPETKQTDIRETGRLTQLMIKYSIPCIVSLLVGALYNIVDQIFIANADYLGSYGNAANTVVYPLGVILMAFAVTFGDGGGSFLSISLGARQKENAHRTVGTCVSTVFLISIVMLLIYAIFQEPLLTLFGGRVNDETFVLAKEYFTWITVGVPFYMVGQSLAGIISADGNPRYSMICTLIGCIINVILDPLYIYKFHWGMRGAAIATITGQIVVTILFLLYLPRMKSVKLKKDSFKPRASLLKKIIPLGANSFFAQFSIVLSMMAVLNMVSRYGALDPIFGQAEYSQIPTAVIGIVMKFFQIVISISIGLASGVIPVVGYNVGAKRNDRVIGIMKRLLIAEVCVGAVACLIIELFPNQLISLFGAANESVYYRDFAVSCIRIFLSLIILSCFNKGAMIFMQALGRAKFAITISVLREIVFGVGLPLLLPVFMGLDGILFFMPLADLLTLFVSAAMLSRVYKELKAPLAVTEKVSASEQEHLSAAQAGAQGETSGTNCVITIGRSYGAGGRTVGKMLAAQLNIPYYDSELLEQVAENSGMSEDVVRHLDEKPTPSVLYSSIGMTSPEYPRLEVQALEAQEAVLEKVGSEGPGDILGQRADPLLAGQPNLLRVFITAPMDSRVVRVEERENLNPQQSRQKILRVDRERGIYYSQHSTEMWSDARAYDLCIDTDKFGFDGTVDMIRDALARLDSSLSAS